MSDARIPVHLEVTGLIRAVQAGGGFGTVLSKGEKDAGTLLVICCHNGTQCCAYERMPRPDGSRGWSLAKSQNPENPQEFTDFCDRRMNQDGDLWILELDHQNAAQFLDPKLAVN